jgi:FkbM family methyltransferase
MNLKKLPRYITACLAAAVRNPPRAYLKMLSRSPYTVRDLPRYGVSMLVDVRDPAISKPILALGEYEEPFTRRLLSFIRPDSHVLDVGANIGFFTLVAARLADRGHVWSIEPDPMNVRLLRANVALNGLGDRVTVHHLAAGDADGELFFSSLGDDRNLGARFTAKAESTLLNRLPAQAPKPVRVPARALDGLLAGEKVDLIKVDVEGYEPAVFAGLRRLLTEQRPVVFTEFAPGTIRHISQTDPEALLRDFRDLDYTFSLVEENGSLSDLGQDTQAVLARHDDKQHHLDLLLRPRERAARS